VFGEVANASGTIEVGGARVQTALRAKTTILPGGKIELTNADLPDGQDVEVIVLLPETSGIPRRSVVDVLAEAPGGLIFKSVDEVDTYLREERDAWER
jgi:hypothetical protein